MPAFSGSLPFPPFHLEAWASASFSPKPVNSSPPREAGKSPQSHFIDGETEAQGGTAAHPKRELESARCGSLSRALPLLSQPPCPSDTWRGWGCRAQKGPDCWGVRLARLWGPQPLEASLPRGTGLPGRAPQAFLAIGEGYKKQHFSAPECDLCDFTESREKQR